MQFWKKKPQEFVNCKFQLLFYIIIIYTTTIYKKKQK